MRLKILKIASTLSFSLALSIAFLGAGGYFSLNLAQNTPPNAPSSTPSLYQAVTDTHRLYLPVVINQPVIRFAVLGDFGWEGQPAEDVANLLKSWKPDFVVTVGDNNYKDGSAETIDPNIGQYYHAYIYPYGGNYGPGANENRFFPALGNHDWKSLSCASATDCVGPYFDYFTLPGNERYYDFTQGAVHFFMLDSDVREPDGRAETSTQGQWLQAGLGNSTAPWKLVLLHHAPYSSGLHGSHSVLQWPYISWGADAVLAGHDHIYERLMLGETPYFVNGLGGRSIYKFDSPLPESVVRYNADYGAMLITADYRRINFQFINRSGEIIDDFTLNKIITPTATAAPLILPTPVLTATAQPASVFAPYYNLNNIPQSPFFR